METIAVPLSGGDYCPHFGGAEQFMICTADQESRTVKDTRLADAPEHKPGALPRWLHEQGTTVVIAGRMGDRARTLLDRLGITAVAGVPTGDPARLVLQFLEGTLPRGDGRCDGEGPGHGQGRCQSPGRHGTSDE